MTQEALKLALDALEKLACLGNGSSHGNSIGNDIAKESIIAIKEALAQPEQEPVAWMFQHNETGRMNYVSNDGIHNPTMFLEMNPRYALVCPLYAHPPQRTWVGLAKEDRLCAKYMQDAPDGIEAVIDYIEAKLKELNT